ncbi:hypothetical protein [Methanolacinia paynteri]|uniref:hypothetical protein n=1 Tax=Methanolacinia paynteri TaxID=230356 RepID=UPI00064EDB09|nr:hypothetical protein [Methanolacinia paynteri]
MTKESSVKRAYEKIKRCIKQIFDAAFPFIDNYLKNKKLSKKYPQSILDGIENSDAIGIDTLKGQYADTMHTKDKLEDKAKISIIGITIAITLITGASGILMVLYEKYPCSIFSWIGFFLYIGAEIYLISGGILAIKVLFDENKISIIELSSYAAGESTLRDDYDKCISNNRIQNLIRNNSIYTSYECIRNALICIFIVFFITAIP